MKKSKKIIASVLALSAVVSLTSCGSRSENAAATTAASESTTITWQTNETMAELQDAVTNVDVDKTIDVTEKIQWLAWWPMDETSAVWETFRLNYGIPKEGDSSYGEYADKIVVFENVGYEARYERLAERILGDDSPDLFPFEIRYFPNSVLNNRLFQPIDDVVDTYSADYSKTRSAMDQFMWNGHNYCAIAPSQLTLTTPLWYRKSVIEDLNLDDPVTLYNEGKWDWDAFRKMLQTFQTSGEDKTSIDGYGDYISNGIICSTGVPIVGIENGKCVNNLNSTSVERAMSFLEEFPRSGWIAEALRTGAINPKKFINKNTLFFTDGDWFYQETLHNLFVTTYNDDGSVKRAAFEEPGDFLVVPWPRDPQADKYYAEIKNSCNMWVSGSKNEAGFRAYCACELAAALDPAVDAVQREKQKKDYDFTDEIMELLYDRYKYEVEPAFDFKNGISARMIDYDSPIQQCINYPTVNEAYNFTELRAEHINAIDAAINETNSTVTG